MTYKVARGKLRHNGLNYVEGDVVPGIADADAKALVARGKLKRSAARAPAAKAPAKADDDK